jgi:hypothetical protein
VRDEYAPEDFKPTGCVPDLIAAPIAVVRKPDGFTRANVAEELLAYFILFSIGFSYSYNFVFHVFFEAQAPDSPAPVSALQPSVLSPSRTTALLWFKRSTDASCRASGVASRPVRG